MKRVLAPLNGFLCACFLSFPHQVLADGNQCSALISKTEITTERQGMETKLVLSGSVNIDIPLTSIGGQPRYEKLFISSKRSDLWELIYYAGQAGTSYMVTEYRKIIIDPCRNMVLGEGKYLSDPQDEKDKAGWKQASWVWGSNTLYVLNSGYRDEVINLPPEKVKGSYQFQDNKVDFNKDTDWPNLQTQDFKDHNHSDAVVEAAKENVFPNFAGKHKIIFFGCGPSCSGFGILNKETGYYFEPGFVVHLEFGQEARMVQYRVDSNLLILTGLLNENGPKGTHYFYFDGKTLMPIQ